MLTLLGHDVGDALNVVLLLLDVLCSLLFVVLVGRLAVPEVVHKRDCVGSCRRGRCLRPQEMLDFLLETV